jgi:peptidoglycan/LPS O-acetylase OafA/YrhL
MNRLLDIFRIDLDTSRRIYGLDILRAIGILIVIEAHAYHLIVDYFPRDFLFIPLLDKVCFSFILSGYLIGSSIIKLYERSDYRFELIRTFWLRRWIRTIPAYFIVITALVILRYTFTTVGFVFPWRHYLFVQNILYPAEADPYYFYPEGWSLAVEEWFYFIVPTLVFIGGALLSRVLSKKQLILGIILGIIAVSTALRVHRALHTPDLNLYTWNIWFRKIVLFRLDTLMYGVLAAFVRFYYRHWWDANRQRLFYGFLTLMGLTLLGYPYFLHNSFWLKSFYITQVAIIVALLVPKLEGMRTGSGWWFYTATYLSKVSFCIYLLNRTPILKSMMQLWPPHGLIMSVIEYIAYVTILILAATLMHKYIEKPILALRPKMPAAQ